jgi:coenzyme F420-0:L-glutamate ligase/coenzyme F420-1:gamma-L-glutamate ligase
MFLRYDDAVLILPVPLERIRPGDDLFALISASVELEDGDILVVSSKAAATAEGTVIDLASLKPGDEAKMWDDRLHLAERDTAFRQAVLNETKRMNGEVKGDCTVAMLAEVRPEGMPHGTILAANAGLDKSNTPKGTAVGWPLDPPATAKSLRVAAEETLHIRIGVVLTDSCCHPRRRGVTAIALAVSGFFPIVSEIGKPDLFGRPMHMTEEAVADQLATAANAVMGNAAQSIPAAVIRDHNIPLTESEGWVPGIDPEEDLFRGAL